MRAPAWWLHEGDAYAWLATCPDKSVDVTLADPPYDASAHKQQKRLDKGKRARGEKGMVAAPLPFEALTESDRALCAQHAVRVTKRWILFFCQVESVHLWIDVMRAAGAKYIRTLVWVKPDFQPQLSGDRPGTGYEHMVLFHLPHKGRTDWNGGGRSGVYTFVSKNAERTYEHPSEKPIALMNALVSDFSRPGEIVLDPFAGSGTTGASCLRLGRQFRGAEGDPHWASVTRERLGHESVGLTLREGRSGQRSLLELLPAPAPLEIG